MATEEVLHTLNDMMGKDVTISLTDGNKFSGILVACSPEMSFGLKYAYKITQNNVKNLLPFKGEVQEKMQFNFHDVINLSACITDEKPGTQAMRFAIDRVYHGKDEELGENDGFEAWTAEDDEGVGSIEDNEMSNDLPDQRCRRNGGSSGWSATDMFEANEKMNVKSTFNADLCQYTTVKVEGTDEDRRRAERLAREIEQNQSSRFYAKLENDDIERDLDKETGEDDFEIAGSHRRGKGNQQQPRRNAQNNPSNGQQLNSRADGLKSNPDRRGSGGFNRFNANNYQGNQQNTSKGSAQYNSNNRRSNVEDYRENDWQSNKGKNQTTDNSFKHQPKQMLAPKPTQSTQKNANDSDKQCSRVAGLKTWNESFTMATKDEAKGNEQGGGQNTGNAWNRGPPSSLVTNKGVNDVSHDSLSSTSMTQSSPSTSRSTDSAPLKKDAQTDASTSVDGAPSKIETINENEPTAVENSETGSTTGTAKNASNFKFNINAPEFKPRAIPTTPQPTTPTGAIPQIVSSHPPPPPQEFSQFPTGQAGGQAAHLAMQGPPIVGGAPPHLVGNNIPQGQSLMMWPSHQPAYAQYQVVPVHHGQIPRAQGQMYQPQTNGSNPPNGHNRAGRQPQQQQVYQQQQWQPQHQGVPIVQGFFQAPFQGAPQQYQIANSGPLIAGGPHPQQPGNFGGGGNQGQRFHPQQQQQQPQIYMQPQQGQRYPQQGPDGMSNSHPNSQPPTPGPQQQQQGQQNPQMANPGMRQGTDSGSNGSLSGSVAGSQSGAQPVRSGSPTNQSPPSGQHQQPPPPGPPQGGQMMAMPPPHPPQASHYMQVPQHQMHPQMHQTPQYYQQVYYAAPHVYAQHGMQMAGPPGQPGQILGEMDPSVINRQYQYGQGNPQFYQQQPHAMSRQNSIPHQQQYQQGGQGPQQGPPQQPAHVGGQ